MNLIAKLRAAFVCWPMVLFIGTSGAAHGQPPKTYHEYFVRTQLRDHYLGKRYTYRHTKNNEDLSLVPKHRHCLYKASTRVLEVGQRLPGSVVVPYRFTMTIDSSDEPGSEEGKLICYWEISDGKQTRSFSRFLVDGQCGGTPEHLGTVLAGPRTEFTGTDPLVGVLNSGGSALSGIGGGAPFDSPEIWFEGFTIEEYNHPKFGRTYLAGGKHNGVPEGYIGEPPTFYNLILPEPEFLVLAAGLSKNVDEFVWSMDSLMEYDGFRFPKTGVSTITDPDGGIKAGSTRWELISIEDFDLMPREGVDWFPEWPTGTTILDHTTGATTRIPFEAREMAQYNRVISKYCDPSIGPVGLASFGWAFWINTALVLGVVGYGAYHWKKRKAFR
jgi:hypothetical protein